MRDVQKLRRPLFLGLGKIDHRRSAKAVHTHVMTEAPTLSIEEFASLLAIGIAPPK